MHRPTRSCCVAPISQTPSASDVPCRAAATDPQTISGHPSGDANLPTRVGASRIACRDGQPETASVQGSASKMEMGRRGRGVTTMPTTTTRTRYGNGQLKPMPALTPTMQNTNEYRAKTREDLRMLSLEHAKTRGAVVQMGTLLQRGFWGRLTWLLRGR